MTSTFVSNGSKIPHDVADAIESEDSDRTVFSDESSSNLSVIRERLLTEEVDEISVKFNEYISSAARS